MTMDLEIWKLLPWAANGRLGEAENEKMASELARHEALRRSLDWEHALRESVRAEAAELSVPTHLLPQLMARIAGEKRSAATQGSWLGKLFSGWQWTPQLAMACSLAVLQFGVIGYLWQGQTEVEPYSEVRVVAPPPVEAPRTFLRVAFKDGVSERDMRDLLHAAGADIVAGPGQLGDYFLLVDPNDVDRIGNAFFNDYRIAGLEYVDALPGKH